MLSSSQPTSYELEFSRNRQKNHEAARVRIVVSISLLIIMAVLSGCQKTADTKSEEPKIDVVQQSAAQSTAATSTPVIDPATSISGENLAFDIAQKYFECFDDEMSIEKLTENAYVVNLVADLGSGNLTLIDSVIIVDGIIVDQKFDENGTADDFNANIDNIANGGEIQTSSSKKTQKSNEQIDLQNVQWNTNNSDAFQNGNIAIANEIFNDEQAYASIKDSAAVSGNWIMRSPWKYYGKFVSVVGTVGTVRIYPPGSDQSNALFGGKQFAEVHLLTTDDQTPICFLHRSDIILAKEGEDRTVRGLPVGTIQNTNAFGGKIEELVIVGTY